MASVLTQLNEISGVQSSAALLGSDGKRRVQITIRPGADVSKVVEEVQNAMRSKVPKGSPVQLENNSDDAVAPNEDWLTVSQLNERAATEKSPARRFDNGLWLLALAVAMALCAFLYWRTRRRRRGHLRSGVRLVAPSRPIAFS